MNIYVDSSALLKLYVLEAGSDLVVDAMNHAEVCVTGIHTIVEIRRSLARLLAGRPFESARRQFEIDLAGLGLLALDASTCEAAASVAESSGVRTLDALHLGAAQRAGGAALTFLTFDVRQAQAARSLGFTVVGA